MPSNAAHPLRFFQASRADRTQPGYAFLPLQLCLDSLIQASPLDVVVGKHRNRSRRARLHCFCKACIGLAGMFRRCLGKRYGPATDKDQYCSHGMFLENGMRFKTRPSSSKITITPPSPFV